MFGNLRKMTVNASRANSEPTYSSFLPKKYRDITASREPIINKITIA